MTISTSIQGMQQSGPDLEREVHESPNRDLVEKAVKQDRPPEVNDPIVSTAIESLNEAAILEGRKLILDYEPKTGMVIMTLYSEDGKEVIRQIPPEEAIRMAQNRKEMKGRSLDSTI